MSCCRTRLASDSPQEVKKGREGWAWSQPTQLPYTAVWEALELWFQICALLDTRQTQTSWAAKEQAVFAGGAPADSFHSSFTFSTLKVFGSSYSVLVTLWDWDKCPAQRIYHLFHPLGHLTFLIQEGWDWTQHWYSQYLPYCRCRESMNDQVNEWMNK